MIKLNVFDPITYLKEKWFKNFVGNELVPPDDMLQSMIAEWGGEFFYHTDPVHGRSLYPWRVEFEKDEDAIIFLLKFS